MNPKRTVRAARQVTGGYMTRLIRESPFEAVRRVFGDLYSDAQIRAIQDGRARLDGVSPDLTYTAVAIGKA